MKLVSGKGKRYAKKTKNKKKMKTGVKVLIIILCLLLLLAGGAAILINSYLNKIEKVNKDDVDIIEPKDEYFDTDSNVETDEKYEELDPEDVNLDTADNESITGENSINIMLIGQDRRPGEGRARSDSMILCSINKETKKITLVSFMRDLYVQIPEYSDNRINASYAFGGMELLDSTLFANFGIKVDYNIEVDFEKFVSVIDAVGGVDISLSSSEANYINNYLGGNVSEGVNHMDGELALSYARIRSLNGSDFARTERQRNVVMAVYNKFRSSDMTTMLDVVNTVFPMVTTDMSNSQILELAMQLFPMLSDSSIETMRIPADDMYKNATIRGMMVLVPDLESSRELLKEKLN